MTEKEPDCVDAPAHSFETVTRCKQCGFVAALSQGEATQPRIKQATPRPPREDDVLDYTRVKMQPRKVSRGEATAPWQQLIDQRIAELEAQHGTAESCGWHEDLRYQYDMEVAAALNELKRLRRMPLPPAPTDEPPRIAHSKSEYKRLKAGGFPVLPPQAS